MKRTTVLVIIILFLTTALLPAAGQREQSLPLAPDVRQGTLENGMDFFVRSHGWPEGRVVLRLVVNAGSVQEQEHEQGLAHFVEHMAFNGTEEFPEGELVSYLESLGIRFGPDINAYTSFDETVYKLDLPADDRPSLERGFRVLQQWASAVTFEPAQIQSERGVIVEEWRRGRGAQARILDQHIPVLLEDSHYASRLPIGEMDVVRSASREDLIGYYTRWYRPDNMAIIAVGDLPAAELERLIRVHLGGIPTPDAALQRDYFSVPRIAGTRISVASDREATRNTVALYRLQDPLPFRTERDYRQMLVRSLYASIMNERLRELARDPDGPIISAGVGWSRFVRDTEITVASATARDGMAPEALALLSTELERGLRFGVLESELARARARFLQSMEQAWVNARNQPSATLADELVRHWTQGEPVPGIEWEYQLYQRLLPGIEIAEVSATARSFAGGSDDDDVVILAGLRDDGGSLPDDRVFRVAIEQARVADLDPPDDTESITTLIPVEPPRGEVVSRQEHQAVGTTELLLENGMRVYIKETDFREDEILVSGFSPGGLSLVDEPLVTAARLAPSVLQESGLGAFSASQLQRFLSGRSVDLTTRISLTSEGFRGAARGADLEVLFQMISLLFTEPRFDTSALETVRRSTLQSISGAMASPQGQFSRRFQELYAAGDPRLGPISPQRLTTVTVPALEQVFAERFADPADFILVITGSVTLDVAADLAERYLGSIPGSGTAGFVETVRDNNFEYPETAVTEIIRAGSEPVAQVGIIFQSEYNWSREENHRFNSLADVATIVLRETIREEAGGTYGVGAAGWRNRFPIPRAFMQIFFGMDPQRSDELIDSALRVVEDLRTRPVRDDYLERVKAQQRETLRQSIRDNDYWLANLQFAIEHGRPLETILEFPDLIEALTAEDIQDVARRYLKPEQRLQLLLLPE